VSKELFEFFQRPAMPLGLLAAALALVWTSGELNARRPPVKLFLYSGDATAEQTAEALALLEDVANVTVTARSGAVPEAEAMEREGARLAIVRSGEHWMVEHRLPTADDEAAVSQLVALVGYSLQEKRRLSAILLGCLEDSEGEDCPLSLGGRVAALPGDSQQRLVPRTIALVTVFLPFLLVTRSYGREVASGMLPVLLSLPDSGWASVVVGKIVAALWLVVMVFLALLLFIEPSFGLSIKPGLVLAVGVQVLAIIVSACLGFVVALFARQQAHVHLSLGLYFLALVLLSGFLFPLETASPVIRLASLASPLSFSGPMLERWLFFGAGALAVPREGNALLVQAAVASMLLALAVRVVRHRV
jgi:hypothetical protein